MRQRSIAMIAVGALMLLSSPAGAAEPTPATAVSNGDLSVPLPVSRPEGLGRRARAEPVAWSPDRAVVAQREPTEGGGLKSGSTEALEMQFEGAKVRSSEGAVVGSVERLLEKPGAGRQAVVSVGGFLGIGTSRVLLPVDALVPDGAGMVRAKLTEHEIEALPEYGK